MEYEARKLPESGEDNIAWARIILRQLTIIICNEMIKKDETLSMM